MTVAARRRQESESAAADSAAWPLVVDMDGTLLKTDTLTEGWTAALFRKPLSALGALFSLRKGRAAFKRRVEEIAPLDVRTLPVRADLTAFLGAERAKGRAIHLVTAADQGVADRVAAHVGGFDVVMGSRPGHNLKGSKKAAALRERFPEGFTYCGDSAADLKVWRDAKGVVLCGATPAVAARAARLAPVEAAFPNEPRGLKAWVEALRVHQWAKNALIFAPLLLSGSFRDPQAVLTALLAFCVVSITASGTYIVNDLSDLSADRQHRSKQRRPFASGALPVSSGLFVAPLAISGGLASAWFLLSPAFAGGLAVYLLCTLSYSMRLKRTPFLDVVMLAALYALRLILGGVALALPSSPWLLTFAMFFFFSLSLAKRHVEVAHAATPGMLPGRGYHTQDAPLTLAFGVGAGLASILILVLYLMEEAFPSNVYATAAWLWGAPLLLSVWIMRVWMLAHRGELHDDPVVFALRDPVSLGLGSALTGFFILAMFA